VGFGPARIALQEAVATSQVRHNITRPYRPLTNGKTERLIQTLLAEWVYARLYPSNEERVYPLPKWHYYNFHRPHTALKGKPLAARVNNVCRHYN